MDVKIISPLFKQCFVTAGVSINFLTHGLVIGYTSVLILALRESTEILVDEESLSWIASIFGISFTLGCLTVPVIMNKCGRKPANASSTMIMAAGWIVISASTSTGSLLLGRFLQGYSMGFLAVLGPVLIGEYTSPRNRGVFLATIILSMNIGVLIVQGLGTILSWKTLSVIFSSISLLDLIIVLLSPESPSFLATRGKYVECRKSFIWLRGQDENEELDKLIKTDMAKKRNKIVLRDLSLVNGIDRMFMYIRTTVTKKEIYKPVLIALHLHGANQWAGAVAFDAYTKDIVDIVIGREVNFTLLVVSFGIQKIISFIIGVVTIKKRLRKPTLAVMISLNVFSYFSIALYVYLKDYHLINFEHPLIGISLIHIFLLSQSAGTITLVNIILGEIFPLEYRGLCGMIGILFFSINETINVKTVLYLFSSIGLHGAFVLYGSLVLYFSSVAWVMLPETKDRTLLDIEEEFRGKNFFVKKNENSETAELEDLDKKSYFDGSPQGKVQQNFLP